MTKNKKFLFLLLFLTVALAIYFLDHPNGLSLPSSAAPTPTASSSTPADLPPLGPVTKTTGCVAQGGLPDQACTPGAIISTATAAEICVSGYSSKVRNVPESEKIEVYKEYGISSHQAGEYEVDHLISLELGGSNNVSNLWPELASPQPGFHQKDAVENYLHQQVCSGAITLAQAQSEIAKDWLSVYRTMPTP